MALKVVNLPSRLSVESKVVCMGLPFGDMKRNSASDFLSRGSYVNPLGSKSFQDCTSCLGKEFQATKRRTVYRSSGIFLNSLDLRNGRLEMECIS